MGRSIYGDILYGVKLKAGHDEENDCSSLENPETEDLYFTDDYSDKDKAGLHQLGYCESELYLLGYQIASACGSEAVELNHEALYSKVAWDIDIKKKCEKLGVEYSRPRFYLTSYLSY